MRRHLSLSVPVLVLVLLLVGAGLTSARPAPVAPAAPQAPVSSAFTFQGQLMSAGVPVTGTCDMTFALFDAEAAGNQIGNPIAASVPVTNSLFTVALNSGGEFGGTAFTGDARWIEVAVKCAGDAGFTTLSPRQQITAAPYAQYAVTSPAAPDAAQSTWIQQSPRNTAPAARSQAVSAYDASNDRLVVFGGSPGSLPHLNDVWVLENASGVAGTSGWTQISPAGGPPTGRAGASAVYDPVSSRLIVFGGCQGNCSPALGDAWVLSYANGLGGTPAWTQLPGAPGVRDHPSAVYDSGSNRMIVFGGAEGWPGTARNTVWVLIDANGIGSPHWVQLSPSGTPPAPRDSAGAVYDPATNRMIVFGGVNMLTTMPYTFLNYNDVWILTHANGLGGTPEWIPVTPAGSLPAARRLDSLTYDPSSNRMTLFGGMSQTDGATPVTTVYGDVWVLTNANGVTGTPRWLELAPNGTLPGARFTHLAAYSAASNRMIMAMGNPDASGTLANDVWLLTNANGLLR